MCLEQGAVDLPQLAVEAMPHAVEALPIQILPGSFDQVSRPTERLANSLAVGERRDRGIDLLLGLPQGRGRGLWQARWGGKVRKARRQVIANVCLRPRGAAGPKLQVKAPPIDRVVAPHAHALRGMRHPGPLAELPIC